MNYYIVTSIETECEGKVIKFGFRDLWEFRFYNILEYLKIVRIIYQFLLLFVVAQQLQLGRYYFYH